MLPRRKGGSTIIITLVGLLIVLTVYLISQSGLPDHPRHLSNLLRSLRSNSSFIPKLFQEYQSPDGHLYFDDNIYRAHLQISQPAHHPIVSLINNATVAWNRKLNSQSKHFSAAVAEYQRRHHRNPPKGYDKWWNWASSNNVRLLDEFDQLHKSIEPFFAIPPTTFRQRAQALVTDQTKWSFMIFVVSIRNGQLSISNQKPHHHMEIRAKEMINLLQDIAHLLPDLDIPISAEDLPVVSVSASHYEQHTQAVRDSSVLTSQDLESTKDQPGLEGWPNLCTSRSELRLQLDGLQTSPAFSQSYIHDSIAASNFCNHPALLQQNGFLSGTRPKVHTFYPLFSFTKLNGFAELLLAPPSQVNQETGDDPDWEEKEGKLMWRGRTTGIYFSNLYNWRQSQRTRLVMFSNQARGNVSVRTTDSHDNLKYFEADTKILNEKYFDVGFTGSALQCENSDGSCEAVQKTYVFKPFVDFSAANMFKYIMDVDGNGWSGRFHRLMSTKSAILKSTIFPEWYADRIQPWYHYIPVRADYQDLYDIMAFFTGDSNGNNHHDDIGKQIGQAGHEWTREFWRKTDMQAYMYLLLLEYSRLLDRDPANLHSMDYF